MPRAGRALEELVQLLERMLANTGVKIKSPEYVMGRLSRSRREIDVSLRSNVGSTKVFVIIECRDRQDIEDVRWIEQLASKGKDVGADKAVAVSKVDFTEGARNLAEAIGIELRIFEDVSPDVVFKWMQIEGVELRIRYIDMRAVSLEVADPSIELAGKARDVLASGRGDRTTPLLVRKADNAVVSVDDVWQTAPGLGDILDRALIGKSPGEKTSGTVRIYFPSSEARFALETAGGGLTDVEAIAISGEFCYEDKLAPISRRYSYTDSTGALAESVEAKLRYDDVELAVGLHATPTGNRFLATASQRNSSGRVIYVDLKAEVEIESQQSSGEGDSPSASVGSDA
jgi:hypothetical protein